jgi:hypothetical protein
VGAGAQEVRLVGDVDGIPERLGGAGDVARDGRLGKVHVDGEALAEVAEEGAAGARVAGLYGRGLSDADEERAGPLDQPLQVRGGHAGDAEGAFLRLDGGQLTLFPGRDQNQDQGGEEGKEHQQEQTRTET